MLDNGLVRISRNYTVKAHGVHGNTGKREGITVANFVSELGNSTQISEHQVPSMDAYAPADNDATKPS